ncbi:MAG: transporter [Candidatus Nealsonbacteria bacterium]|nr:transporter [Candidatus Nealsonbacteria bacterium]
MSPFLIILIPILTAATAQILFKKGVSELGQLDFSISGVFNLIPRILQSPWLLVGMFLFGISFLVYLFVISKLQLNVVYPIVTSSGVILISLLAWVLFKESLSILQIAGIAVIVFGIFLLTTKG